MLFIIKFLCVCLSYRISNSNLLHRTESVVVGSNKEITINAKFVFIAEDQLKYHWYIDYENNDYNVTYCAAPFRRIPPSALKSLVG